MVSQAQELQSPIGSCPGSHPVFSLKGFLQSLGENLLKLKFNDKLHKNIQNYYCLVTKRQKQIQSFSMAREGMSLDL